MNILTGFAVVNCEVGKKIAFTYTIIDENGNVTKSNTKESYVAVDESVLNAIQIIEDHVKSRING